MRVVYFIQSGHDGPIKIGVATDIEKRLAGLQIGNPVALQVMATVPGDEDLEQQFHARFAIGRRAGEWFERDTPGLLELIHHVVRFGELPELFVGDEADGGTCRTCGWAQEIELAERGEDSCWRCRSEKRSPRTKTGNSRFPARTSSLEPATT